MCWPELIGGVEIEERRPRNWNEPRRKRLNFVRSHRHDPEEWQLTKRYPGGLTEREKWDHHRAQGMEQRWMHPVPHAPLQGYCDPRMLQMPPGPPQSHHIPHAHPHGFDQRGHHGRQEQLDRHSHHSEGEFTGYEDHGNDGHDGHDNQGDLEPRIITRKPAKSHLPKGVKAHGKKPECHKKKYLPSSSSSDECSSSDSSSEISEGFGAGRRTLPRRPVRRGRSRSRFTDDSFEDLMQTGLRSRSRRARR